MYVLALFLSLKVSPYDVNMTNCEALELQIDSLWLGRSLTARGTTRKTGDWRNHTYHLFGERVSTQSVDESQGL